MDWYPRVYIGESLAGQEQSIRRRLERGKYRRGIWLITGAMNGTDLLDIRPSTDLARPGLKGMMPPVGGISRGKWEACQLVIRILEDCYAATGGYDVISFLRSG